MSEEDEAREVNSEEGPGSDSKRSLSPVKAVLRGLERSAFGLFLFVGWLAALVFAGLWISDKAGWIHPPLEALLRNRLGPLAEELDIASIDVRWRDRELVLKGVRLGQEAEEAYLGRIGLRLGWREPHGLVVDRIGVRDGYVRVTSRLIELANSLKSEPRDSDMPMPVIIVDSVDVGFEFPQGPMLTLGRLDALAKPRADGGHALKGRLQTLARNSDRRIGELIVLGELSPEGVLTARSTARELQLASAWQAILPVLQEGGGVETLANLDPQGFFDLDASGTLDLGGTLLPQLDLSLHTRDVSLQLPHLQGPDGYAEADRLSDVSLKLEARFDPQKAQDSSLFAPAGWSGSLEAEARWREIEARLGGRAGPAAGGPGAVTLWAHLPRVPVDEQTLRVAGRPEFLIREVWNRVEPRGRVDVSLGARIGPGFQPAEGWMQGLEIIADADPAGTVSAAYHGPISARGVRDEGFPLRLDQIEGRVVFAWSPQQLYAEELALHALVGKHAGGEARVDGSLHFIPRLLGRREGLDWAKVDFWLRGQSDRLLIDSTMERAFEGLSRVIPPEKLWHTYGPQGGELGFVLDLWLTPTTPRLGTHVQVDLLDAQLNMRDFPLPVRDLTGELEIAVDGRSPEEGGGGFALGLDLEARANATPEPVHVRGRRVRFGPEPLGFPREDWQVQAPVLDVADPELLDVLRGMVPELASGLKSSELRGEVGLTLRRTRERPGAPSITRVELNPGNAVSVVPPGTDLRLEGLEGRVLVRVEESPHDESDAAPKVKVQALPLAGFWEEGGPRIPWFAQGGLDRQGELGLALNWSGVPLEQTAVLKRLVSASANTGTPGELDLERLGLSGTLDFHVRLETAETGSLPPAVSERERAAPALRTKLDLYPRSAGFALLEKDFLSGIEGRLEYEDGSLGARQLRATLGRTPVELRDLDLDLGPSGGRLETDISFDNLPLDAAHLQYFLPADLLNTLIDDLGWRGRIDVEDGRLVSGWSADGQPQVSFHGNLRIADLFARLGLPLSVRSALAQDVALIYEEGAVRAWGEIKELYAQMDGRRLDDASMVASFVQPRLTVERFDGRFEGGRLSSLGTEAGNGSGGFLTLNLEPPYPFGLSIETAGVDLEGLLRGMFNSDFANQGVLRGNLRLNGDTQDLGNMRGQGFVEMAETSLWSIPVFQALFSQLGFDSTAVFDQMRCAFQVEDGFIRMRNMRAESPLLSIVGEGQVGFDASLDHKLEVRYALVDQLGPFRRLLYWIQRSLLRISIGGSMERPKVDLKGLLPTFFNLSRPRRELPVPSFSPLPVRF